MLVRKIKLCLLSVVTLLAGCASTDGKSVFERIEFEEMEVGCARIQGAVEVTTSLFASTSAQLTVVKRKTTYISADGTVKEAEVPDC